MRNRRYGEPPTDPNTPQWSFGRSDQEDVVDDDLLSRTLACILRHQTELLEQKGSHMPGFMAERRLLIAVYRHNWKLRNCTTEDLVRVVDESLHREEEKPRFEVQRDKRRDRIEGEELWFRAIADKKKSDRYPALLDRPEDAHPLPDAQETPDNHTEQNACATDATETTFESEFKSEFVFIKGEYDNLRALCEQMGEQMERQESQLMQLRLELDKWNSWWENYNWPTATQSFEEMEQRMHEQETKMRELQSELEKWNRWWINYNWWKAGQKS